MPDDKPPVPITEDDIQRAQSAWKRHTVPQFATLLDAKATPKTKDIDA